MSDVLPPTEAQQRRTPQRPHGGLVPALKSGFRSGTARSSPPQPAAAIRPQLVPADGPTTGPHGQAWRVTSARAGGSEAVVGAVSGR